LAARKLEGIPQFKELKKGEPPRAIEVREGPIKYLADLLDGHKTGAYLDQQMNRLRVSRWARGRGLDAFSYQGHFALHLAGGCDEVVALESSGPALDRLKLNCELNNIANVVPVKANVFEELPARAERGERFDIIVLDPPPFAKSKKDLVAARKGYRELNRRALQLLNPGGRLITYSCSYHLTPDLFLGILREAAADARRPVRLLEPQTQALDHPILLTVPESQYLKGFALEAGE
jgi:23S rRNA (cytosine1962-C5)-methyltransferase